MEHSVKTAISLPAQTYQRAEAVRKKAGKSRSELYAQALDGFLRVLEVREMEARYEAGYRKHPETREEVAEIEAWTRAAAESWDPKDKW